MKKILLIAVAMAALVAPILSRAESNITSPAAVGATATARLNFSVVIPSVLYLAVGTNTTMAANATVDPLVFTVPAASIGAGTASVVVTGGDISPGAVTVRVFANVGGNVSLNSTTTGQLKSGTDLIPWTDIAVASAPLTATTPGYTNAGITHPTFNNAVGGGAGTLVTLTAASKVVRQEGKWTFSYANTNTYPAGTYGAAGGNGIVTYTATAL